jgi:hypothetical protein
MMMARAAHPRWEYLVKPREAFTSQGKDEIAAGLNKLGDEGWELVSIDAGAGTYVFKRAKGAPGGHGGAGMMGMASGMSSMGGPGSGIMPGSGGGKGGRGVDLLPSGTGPGMPVGRGPAAAESVQIIRLKYLGAQAVADTIKEVLGKDHAGIRVAAESQTNSLLVGGQEHQIDTIRKLVVELDQAAKDGPEPGRTERRRKAEQPQNPGDPRK